MRVEKRIYLYYVSIDKKAYKIDVTEKSVGGIEEFVKNNPGRYTIKSSLVTVDEQ